MAWNDDAWKDSYDDWKLQTPPEYDESDDKEDYDPLADEDDDFWLDLLSQEEASDG
jgi:hypothetical protein